MPNPNGLLAKFFGKHPEYAKCTVNIPQVLDEDGNIKRCTDLRSDAGVAWSKVHAVYPSITPEQLVRMSIDQIIARDPSKSRL